MGTSTKFTGFVQVLPELTLTDYTIIKDLHDNGPWGRDISVGRPEGYCQWEVNTKCQISWDGGEKFYDATKWMKYIVSILQKKGYFCNGKIDALAEDGEQYTIKVTDNDVQKVEKTSLEKEFFEIAKVLASYWDTLQDQKNLVEINGYDMKTFKKKLKEFKLL